MLGRPAAGGHADRRHGVAGRTSRAKSSRRARSRNAVCAVLALSGSINCVKHLQAIATEADSDVDVYRLFEDYADKVPLLAGDPAERRPGSSRSSRPRAARARCCKRLERFLDLDARVVTGERLGDVLADVEIADERVIRHGRRAAVDAAVDRDRARQSLARRRHRAARRHRRAHAEVPRARQTSSTRATRRSPRINDGKVKPGDVVILRGLGVIGGPAHGADIGRRVRARRRRSSSTRSR